MDTTDVFAVAVPDESGRLAAVRRYAILDTPPDGAFDRVAALAARVLDAPVASVTIVDEDRIWFKASQGLPEGVHETGRDPGLCASAILHGEPYTVTDALTDPRTAGNALVHGELAVRFYAAAPITTSDGHRLGTVNVIDTRPREVTDEELSTLQDLAAVVMDELELRLSAMRTVALERELLHVADAERARLERLAATLQRSLLPTSLPDVPGVELAAHYRAASAEQVGGDFYDVFPLTDGRWGFFLGDVCGKGPEAAALTSLTRYALRSAAVYDPDPVRVLTRLNTVLRHEDHTDTPRYCTVLFGLLDPDDGGAVVTLAGGGHPPAFAIRAGGRVDEVCPVGGQLVGILPDAHFAQVTCRLAPGESLLLYTDGLSEARGPDGLMLGHDGLAAFLETLPTGAGATGTITALRELLARMGDKAHDDTALLVMTAAHPVTPEGLQAVTEETS